MQDQNNSNNKNAYQIRWEILDRALSLVEREWDSGRDIEFTTADRENRAPIYNAELINTDKAIKIAKELYEGFVAPGK